MIQPRYVKRRQEKEIRINEERLVYEKSPKICPKCSIKISFKRRNAQFCSYQCANQRGPRSEETKKKIRKSVLAGLPPKRENIPPSKHRNDWRNWGHIAHYGSTFVRIRAKFSLHPITESSAHRDQQPKNSTDMIAHFASTCFTIHCGLTRH